VTVAPVSDGGNGFTVLEYRLPREKTLPPAARPVVLRRRDCLMQSYARRWRKRVRQMTTKTVCPQIKSPSRPAQAHGRAVAGTHPRYPRTAEIRVLTTRRALRQHLGVVELNLHCTYFDFAEGTGPAQSGTLAPDLPARNNHRAGNDRFHTIRTKAVDGFPHPGESEYDLFIDGHAGARLHHLRRESRDELLGRTDNHAVAVIGEGASRTYRV